MTFKTQTTVILGNNTVISILLTVKLIPSKAINFYVYPVEIESVFNGSKSSRVLLLLGTPSIKADIIRLFTSSLWVRQQCLYSYTQEIGLDSRERAHTGGT